MNKVLLFIGLTLFLNACNLFEYKEKKAIEICQKAKADDFDGTWLDFANAFAKQDPDKKYNWHAKKTEDNKFFIVDFTDSDGWGQSWEVDIDQQIVKNINQNDYLLKKYGLSRFGGNEEFEIKSIEQKELKDDQGTNGEYYTPYSATKYNA